MDIIIIGNGFDIAHKLPTQYKDFLNFVNGFYDYKRRTKKISTRIVDNKVDYSQFFSNLTNTDNEALENFEENITQNIWIDYFLDNSTEHETWVGFENDIFKIIKLLEECQKEYNKKVKIDTKNIYETSSHKELIKILSKHFILENQYIDKYKFLFFKISIEEYNNPKNDILNFLYKKCFKKVTVKTKPHINPYLERNIVLKYKCGKHDLNYDEYHNQKYLKKYLYRLFYRPQYSKDVFARWNALLISNLNRLISALNFYLYYYVGKISISYSSPDILEICEANSKNTNNNLKLLSFNYTNTFESNYTKNVKTHYIHGKATGSKSNCNIVLGINEYLNKKERSQNVDFIDFQKYFQRIQKRTGNEYKNWLSEINNQKYDNKEPKHKLYIFGHSLDVTDSDIIKEFILNKHIETTIFYHDQQAYENRIRNLIKIIGKDELIKRTSSTHPTIIFQQQENIISTKRRLD